MKPIGKRCLLGICLAVSVTLCMARGAFWEYRFDEGTTFDVAIDEVTAGRFVPAWPEPPVPISELFRSINAEAEYTAGDTLDALDATFRTFHPPAYYLLIHAWTRMVGTARIPMRLPAYLLAAITLLGMVQLARRVIPERNAGPGVAVIFALSPWIQSITNYARPYHLALAIGAWATVAALAGQEPGRRKRWRMLFVALSILGIYTLYHYAFLLVWQLGLMACLAASGTPEQRRSEFKSLGLYSLTVALAFSPWLWNLIVHMHFAGQGNDYFHGAVAAPHWPQEVLRVLADFALADAPPVLGRRALMTIAAVLGLLTLPLILWAFLGAPRKRLDRRARCFWATAPLLPLLFLLSDLFLKSHTIFITKICFGFMLLLIPLVVRAWLVVPHVVLRSAGLSAWALLFLATSLCSITSRATRRSDSESAVALLGQDDSEEHLIVLSSDHRGFVVPFLLVMRDAGIRNVRVIRPTAEKVVPMLSDRELAARFPHMSLVLLGPTTRAHVPSLIEAAESSGRNVRSATRPWPTDVQSWGLAFSESRSQDAWVLGPILIATLSGTR